MSLNYIGEQQDPITFILTQFSSSNGSSIITDERGNNIPFRTVYPLDASQLPCAVVKGIEQNTQWLNIGAERIRWYGTYQLEIYEANPASRYNVERQIRDRIFSIANTQLAPNYVFMWPLGQIYSDELQLFGSPIYRSIIRLQLIYDITQAIA